MSKPSPQYPEILGVCLSLTLLMVVTVSLRLVVRAQTRRLSAADYVMLISMLFSVIYSALCIAQRKYALGLPINLRPKENLPTYKKLNYAGRPFYQLGIAGFKASVCLSYLRLLSKTSMSFYRILIWSLAAFSTLGHIAATLVFCSSAASFSWRTDMRGTCLPIAGTFYGLAVFTILYDILTIFLPIPLLLRLKIKPAQKAGVVCLFLLGLFTTVCSIMRVTPIHRVAYGDDNSTALVLWGTIEFNVGGSMIYFTNIITCVPCLAPLLKGRVRDFRSNSAPYMSPGHYALESGKDPRSQLRSIASAPAPPRRTPSEELSWDSWSPRPGGDRDDGGVAGVVGADGVQGVKSVLVL
ncbi:hypothetical protein BBP40_010887 [Aspergillus hancockii]|nr:hypothetical protein BBP40_010887 [Aspergillus hancockii]